MNNSESINGKTGFSDDSIQEKSISSKYYRKNKQKMLYGLSSYMNYSDLKAGKFGKLLQLYFK